MALLLSVAYFLNPGIHGMLIYDFHAESLIVLFYICTFYFYVKKELKRMLVSLLLLLGSMEVAPFLAVMLGLGLVLYEMLHTKNRSIRMKNIRFAAIIIALSLAVLLTYNLIAAHLTSAYISGYAGLPPTIRVLSINSREINNLVVVLKGATQFVNIAELTLNAGHILIGLVIIFLGFGIAALMDPITSIILTAPWFVEVFVLGRLIFASTWNQYFSFAFGGGAVSTLLAMKRWTSHKRGKFFRAVFASSIIIFVVILSVMGPSLVRSRNTNNLNQCFLFQVNTTQEKYYSELNYVISKVPPNASLMTPFFTLPHLYARRPCNPYMRSDLCFR